MLTVYRFMVIFINPIDAIYSVNIGVVMIQLMGGDVAQDPVNPFIHSFIHPFISSFYIATSSGKKL